jgi:hypothetical protein
VTSREEALAAYEAAQPKVDAALEAVQSNADDWEKKAAEALPAMRAFSGAISEYAYGQLGLTPPSPKDPDEVVDGILRDLGQGVGTKHGFRAYLKKIWRGIRRGKRT